MIFLNGGPGCTTMLGAFLLNGPCVVDDDSFYFDNPYAWNSKLNILYIDAPAGVGFSWAKNSEDKKYNDYISSVDNMKAVLEFFKKFPELIKNDVYLAGDSYAGVYIPYLAMRIHQHNQEIKTHNNGPHINMKGILVGNACTDWTVDTYNSRMDFSYMHNIVDQDTYFNWRDHKCERFSDDVFPPTPDPVCDQMWERLENHLSDNINPYDIYRDEHPVEYN